jgi:hypothetical protein
MGAFAAPQLPKEYVITSGWVVNEMPPLWIPSGPSKPWDRINGRMVWSIFQAMVSSSSLGPALNPNGWGEVQHSEKQVVAFFAPKPSQQDLK